MQHRRLLPLLGLAAMALLTVGPSNAQDVPVVDEHDAPEEPATLGCSVGPYFGHGMLFVDQGVFVWPKDMPRPRPALGC